MNGLELVNKVIGVVFAVVLVGVFGMQAKKWRDEAAKEAGRLLQKSIKQSSDEIAAEFQRNAPKWPTYKFEVGELQGLKSSTFSSEQGRR